MNWIFGVLLVLILFFLKNNSDKKKKQRKIQEDLINNWSKSKNKEDFHFPSIEKYFKNTNQKEKAFHIISDRCAKDLDINETFKIIDRTSSKVGQQYLYYKLRTIKNQNNLLNFNELTILFENNENLRIKTQLALNKINTNSSYYFEELVTSKPIEKPKIIWLVYTLSILTLCFVILGLFSPLFFLILVPIFAINFVLHFKNKYKIAGYLDGISQLTKVLNVSKKIASYPEIKQHFTDVLFIKKLKKIKQKNHIY